MVYLLFNLLTTSQYTKGYFSVVFILCSFYRIVKLISIEYGFFQGGAQMVYMFKDAGKYNSILRVSRNIRQL